MIALIIPVLFIIAYLLTDMAMKATQQHSYNKIRAEVGLPTKSLIRRK